LTGGLALPHPARVGGPRGFIFSLLLCMLLWGFSESPQWRVRRRAGVRENKRAAALILPTAWGPEPTTPVRIELPRLARALRAVCGVMPPGRAERYAEWIDTRSRQHGEDPFLLAAIMYRTSRCLPDSQTIEGLGLTAIQPSMYRDNARGRRLTYKVFDGTSWAERRKDLDSGFFDASLENAEANIEWAAALLSMWREQHATVDQNFPNEPHRHYVSHFVWGDRVKSARAEDRIFTDRRRLLLHYGVSLPSPTHEFRKVTWGSPLEGAPRVVSSQPGADREQGLRLHRGVDVEATLGESVLSVADGRVSFAGVDFPGHANNAAMDPAQIETVPRSALGHGGRYVCVTHVDGADGSLVGEDGKPEAWLRSCYMHLEDVRVRVGQRVSRGDVVGTVGRTGMKSSAPHLHLEIKTDRKLYDARDVLVGSLIGEPPVEPKRKKKRRLAAASNIPVAASAVTAGIP
jgi:murein DD-endopeptidase MepM/ murein hydrolase activator NlpD